MRKRSLWIYGTVALAGSLVGGGAALWTAGGPSPVRIVRTAVPHRAMAKPPPVVLHKRPLAVIPLRSPLYDLKLMPPEVGKPGASGSSHAHVAASKTKSSSHTHGSKKSAPEGKSHKPLDLTLPAANRTLANAPPVDADANPAPAVSPKSELDLSPASGDDSPDVKTINLFNTDTGLRGFMTQNWVNHRLGFQGGLAIREKRLREDGSNLENNVAVGMGVLLAF